VLSLDAAGRLVRAVELQDTISDDPLVAMGALAAAGASELFIDADAVPVKTARLFLEGAATAFSGCLTIQVEPGAIADVGDLLALGVSRVAVQRVALEDPNFISAAARRFRSDALAVAISAREENGVWRVYKGAVGPATEWGAVTWARVAEAQGAAELIVQPLGDSSTAKPYGLNLLAELTRSVARPVVARVDPGSAEDILDALLIGDAEAVLLDPALLSRRDALRKIREYLEEHGISSV
jgi:cyclase